MGPHEPQAQPHRDIARAPQGGAEPRDLLALGGEVEQVHARVGRLQRLARPTPLHLRAPPHKAQSPGARSNSWVQASASAAGSTTSASKPHEAANEASHAPPKRADGTQT